jgi:hypothetical protein
MNRNLTMPMRALGLALVATVAAQDTARADPLFGSYLAGNTTGVGSLSVSNSPQSATYSDLQIQFTTPPTGIYRVDSIEVTAWQSLGSGSFLHAQFSTSINGLGTNFQTSVALATTPQLQTLQALSGIENLNPGTTYYLHLSVDSGSFTSVAKMLLNAAGVTGTINTGSAFSWVAQSSATYPAVRINAHPVPPITPTPAYSALSTVGSPPAPFTAEMSQEIICPGPTNPFTCPVWFTVPATPTPTSAAICQLAANAINANASACWGSGGLPQDFHGYCSGNVLRVTNTTAGGVCSGAAVCIDHVENLNKFMGLLGPISYEYLSVKDPLVLELRNAASGRSRDAGTADLAQIVINRRFPSRGNTPASIRLAEIRVSITSGMTAEEVALAIAGELFKAGDTLVRVAGPRVYFDPGQNVSSGRSGQPLPRAPGLSHQDAVPTYDVAVRITDSAIDWAMSPLENLLEISDQNPTPPLTR